MGEFASARACCRLHCSLRSWGCSGLFAKPVLVMNPGRMSSVLVFLISTTDTRVGHVSSYKDE